MKKLISIKTLIICILGASTLFACEKIEQPDNSAPCSINFTPEEIQLYNQLMQAYKANCKSCLKDFLNQWALNNQPKYPIPTAQLDIYSVFEEFYSPWDLDRIADSEFGNDIYKNINYYVVQTHIIYDYHFKKYKSTGRIVINDFRPKVNHPGITTLNLLTSYENVFDYFLEGHCVNNHRVSEEAAFNEGTARYDFINEYLLMFRGHWGNNWHLETHPEVNLISFNTAKDSAQVYFRLGYQGGEVILAKTKLDEWEIVEKKMTWIE